MAVAAKRPAPAVMTLRNEFTEWKPESNTFGFSFDYFIQHKCDLLVHNIRSLEGRQKRSGVLQGKQCHSKVCVTEQQK